ncbi:MAG: extracellular solute-binding protein [Spirochaetales bacterium]|nr:extracellular solute-binding protein [Spirochaetales bacterium]
MRNRVMMIALAVLLCTTAMLGANGTEEGAEKAEKLVFWHTYSDGETALFEQTVLPAFEALGTGIEVEAVRMPYEGLKQQVIAGIAGDAGPDVMRMDLVWVPEFAKLGGLVPVSQREGFDSLKADFFEGSLATNYYNGEFYGIPLNTNTKVAVWNKALLAELGITELPTTMDDVLKLAQGLEGDDRWPLAIGGAGSWGMLPWFWTMGGQVTDEAFTRSTGYLDSEASIQALQTIADLYAQGQVGPCLLGEEPGTWGGMENGNYLMMDDGPWYYSIVGDSALENTVFSTLPAGPGGSVSVVGGENMVMMSTCENQDAAWEFMNFMVSPSTQITMAEVGMIPTRISAATDPEAAKAPYFTTYVEQLKTAKPRTPHPHWGKISDTLGLAFESVIRGELTAQEALPSAAQTIDGFLAK